MENILRSSIRESIKVLKKIQESDLFLKISKNICNLCVSSIKNGGKIIFAGNGGSAADSQHLCAELIGRFKKDRPPINSISLNTNNSSLTAIANDFDYSDIFSRQLEAVGNHKDMLIAISTSGNSKNIIELVKKAKKYGYNFNRTYRRRKLIIKKLMRLYY